MASHEPRQRRGLQASSYPSEHPVRYVSHSSDGRSPGLRISVVHLLPTIARSGPTLSRRENGRQSAYSCGGSHGLGPYRAFRTVFPIIPRSHPVGNRRLLHRTSATDLDSMSCVNSSICNNITFVNRFSATEVEFPSAIELLVFQGTDRSRSAASSSIKRAPRCRVA